MITIQDQGLKTSKPADLAKALIETTGCGPAEVAQMLRGWPNAGFVARALHPHLTDKISIYDLTALIAPVLVDATEKVIELYAKHDAPAEPSAGEDGGTPPTTTTKPKG